MKLCFWTGNSYDWSGATEAQIAARDEAAQRAVSQSMRGYGGLMGHATSHCILDACTSGNVANLRRYLDTGGDPNSRGSEKEPAIVRATRASQLACVELLLARGARVDECWSGDSALLHSANIGNADIARVLLSAVGLLARPTSPRRKLLGAAGVCFGWPAC